MSSTAEKQTQNFGIGAVAKLTGLSDHTIRVWERRYGAVETARAANGRRLYTSQDIEKLGLLKVLTEKGISIGKIANEEIDELRDRIGEVSELAAQPAPACIG